MGTPPLRITTAEHVGRKGASTLHGYGGLRKGCYICRAAAAAVTTPPSGTRPWPSPRFRSSSELAVAERRPRASGPVRDEVQPGRQPVPGPRHLDLDDGRGLLEVVAEGQLLSDDGRRSFREDLGCTLSDTTRLRQHCARFDLPAVQTYALDSFAHFIDVWMGSSRFMPASQDGLSSRNLPSRISAERLAAHCWPASYGLR